MAVFTPVPNAVKPAYHTCAIAEQHQLLGGSSSGQLTVTSASAFSQGNKEGSVFMNSGAANSALAAGGWITEKEAIYTPGARITLWRIMLPKYICELIQFHHHHHHQRPF